MNINMNEIRADYNYWVKWNDWDISQMTALLLGYNPISLNRNYIEQLVGGIIKTNLSSLEIEDFVEEYEKAYSLIMNSIEAGKLKFRTSPKKFYDWATSKKLPLVFAFHEAMKSKPRNPHSSELNIKRQNQLYKMILSIAIIKFNYNPENLKNSSTAKFRHIIERAGFSVDDNTIRDVVNTSYEHFKDHLDHSVFKH